MRAFVAIELPSEIQDALTEVQTRIQARLRSRALGNAGFRWALPQGIHLTLKFLGEISDVQSTHVVDCLSRLGSFERIRVEVKGYGFFPDRRRPQVLWAGLIAPPALAELARRIEGALAAMGFPAENRKFAPHLTLARLKTPRRQPVLEALLAELCDQPLGQFEVSEFFLFESHLSFGSPAQYRKVARFPNPDPLA
ncbi:MAG TPA: RNA 2',3'-cyclic phosphodiesterase [Terriglobia bacterium]|nr:RNA 2',3'-cyclic phosphodiesterase [Terriglobia bacterium]